MISPFLKLLKCFFMCRAKPAHEIHLKSDYVWFHRKRCHNCGAVWDEWETVAYPRPFSFGAKRVER